MRTRWISRISRGIGAVGLICLLTAGVAVADRLTVPEGIVIGLRMDDSLSSATSDVGDRFKATVSRSVYVNDRIAIPADSRVDGRVTVLKRAESGVRSGVIGVEFFRLSLPGNESYDIEAGLTSLEPDELQQAVEPAQFGAARNRVFVGSGISAVLSAALAGFVGQDSLLAGGTEAQVASGSEVAMQLLRPVSLKTSGRGWSGRNDRTVYTSAHMIRGAQAALRDRRYYRGPVNGALDEALRQAIGNFQKDNRQRVTGELDEPTASLLGLVRMGEAPARDSELSASIYRKAQSLLDRYEEVLGVRFEDIRSGLRSNHVLTEWDLDLLLQVSSFANAAHWYDQASRDTRDDEAAIVVARILLRSADQVEGALRNVREDRQFKATWDSIQSDLPGLDRENVWTHEEDRRGHEHFAQSGRFRWQGKVDGTDNIVLRGSKVRINHLRSKSVEQVSHDLSGPLPSRAVTVTLNRVRGRGGIRLLEQPSAANNYAAVVQVEDQKQGGRDWYEFTLDW